MIPGEAQEKTGQLHLPPLLELENLRLREKETLLVTPSQTFRLSTPFIHLPRMMKIPSVNINLCTAQVMLATAIKTYLPRANLSLPPFLISFFLCSLPLSWPSFLQ